MFPVRFIRWLTIGGLAAVVWVTPITAQGKGPKIRFDFPHAVECRDVTSPERARQYPLEKTVEATFRISTRIAEGHEEDLVEFVFEIRSHSERMRVAEFLPGTTLESDLVGEIELTETNETIGKQGVSIGAALPIPYGDLTFSGRPAADIARTRRNTRTETKRTVPPSRVVVSSGTMHTEHGVFFKFRRSRHSAFEDMREFTVRFVVPRPWRGDWVHLNCHAQPIKTGLSLLRAKPSTASIFMGLHLAGDIEARQTAYRLAHAQIGFLDASQQSVARRFASSVNRLVDRAQAGASNCLAKIGLERAADLLPASTSKGPIEPVGAHTDELRAACDAMNLLGRDAGNSQTRAGVAVPMIHQPNTG